MKILSLNLAKAYERLGRAYEERSEYAEALSVYQQARELVDAGHSPQLYGVLLHGIANNLINTKDDRAQALLYYRQAQTFSVTIASKVISMEAEANVLLELEQTSEAAEVCQRGLALLQTLPAPGEPRRMANLYYLFGRIYRDEERYTEALTACQQALDLLDFERDPQLCGVILHTMGNIYQLQDGLAEAAAYYQRAAECKARSHHPRDFVTTLQALIYAHSALSQYEQALREAERALGVLRALPPPGSLFQLTWVLLSLSELYALQNEPERALPLLEEFYGIMKEEQDLAAQEKLRGLSDLALVYTLLEREEDVAAIRQLVLSVFPPEEQKQALETIDLLISAGFYQSGRNFERQEYFADALQAYRNALRWLNADLQPQRYGVILHVIGDIYYMQEMLDKAIQAYQQAAEYKERGENRADLVVTLEALAKTQAQAGQAEPTLQTVVRAEAILRELPAPGRPDLLLGMLALRGQIQLALELSQEALAALEEAQQLEEAEKLLSVPEHAALLLWLADAYLQVDRPEELPRLRAARQALEPEEQREQVLISFNRLLAGAYHRRARVYEREKLYIQALAAYQQILSWIDGEQEPQYYGVVLHDIADVYLEQEQLEEALVAYQQAAKYKERGENRADLTATLDALAKTQIRLERWDEASRTAEHCLEIARALPVPGRPERVLRVLALLGQIEHIQGRSGAAWTYIEEAVRLAENEQITAQNRQEILGLAAEIYGDLAEPADVQQARAFIQEQFSEEQRASFGELAGVVYRRRGQAKVEEKRLGEALAAYQQALFWIDAVRDPQFYGVILHDIGDVYLEQERFEEALVMYQQAAASKERGENRLDLAVTLNILARTQAQMEQAEAALGTAERCLALLRSLPAPGRPDLLLSILALSGQILLAQERFEEALTALEEAQQVEEAEKLLSAPERAALLLWIATASIETGQAEKLERLRAARQALEPEEQREQALAAFNRRLADVYFKRARTYERQKRYAEALETYQEALHLLNAEEEPEVYGVVLHNIGDVYFAQERFEAALATYQQAGESKKQGEDGADLAITWYALAGSALRLERMTLAAETIERALALLRGLPGGGRQGQLARTLTLGGQIALQQNEPELAHARLEEARMLMEERGGLSPQECQMLLISLMTACAALGKDEELVNVHSSGRMLLRDEPQALAPFEAFVAGLYFRHGDAYADQGNVEQALHFYQQMLRLLDSERDPDVYGIALHNIAVLYERQGDREQALLFYQQAREAKSRGADTYSLCITLDMLANVHLELGQMEQALTLYQECLAILEELPVPDEDEGTFLRPDDPNILMQVARCQEALRNRKDALMTYERLERVLQAGPMDQTSLRRLAWVKYKRGIFEEALRLTERVDAPLSDIDGTRARLIEASIAALRSDRARAEELARQVAAGGLLAPDILWETGHDVRVVQEHFAADATIDWYLELFSTLKDNQP